ncbi:calcium-binding protein [Sorangium sp. So ce321]|uniref:calcium-binding protein n=1 Tax=Sorangium sp. So ce321 TaxID=3133300 RepID=UPI003F64750A
MAEVVDGTDQAQDEVKEEEVKEEEVKEEEVTACWADFGPEAPGECTIGEERACDDYDSMGPTGFCREKCVNIDGEAVWGLKTYDYQCPFYDSAWYLNTDGCECVTPLVLSFDNRSVEFTAGAGAAFDLTGTGVCHASDWPTSATPWLALDRDGDGVIRDGGELFGSATRLEGGGFAKNGFEALRDLDADHNGVFDKQDPAFARVVVWSDRNLDRTSEPSEIKPLEAIGLTSIDLHDSRDMRCDARGNCEGERSAFAFTDAAGTARRGTVIDVYMSLR